MSASIQNLPPQQYERQVLPTLVEKAKEYDARVKSFIAQGNARHVASGELNAFGQELKQWESYFRQFEPAAQTLAQANLPTMHQWLDWAIKDMPDLQRTIAQWAQQAAQHEATVTDIVHRSDQQILQTMQQIHDARQVSYQNVNDLWSKYLKG
jgi:hypothetical protein